MPSDEMVEKVARAIWEVWRTSDIAPEMYHDFSWDELRALGEKYPAPEAPGKMLDLAKAEARAALAAAEAGEQPVLSGYGDYTPVTIRAGTVASPPSEASRDERAAIRKEAFEEAAKVVKPKDKRPCDCKGLGDCNCGKDRLIELEVWLALKRAATAIRARGET